MDNISAKFETDGAAREIEMVFVKGTHGVPFLFGNQMPVDIADFFISKFPVTQALWKYVMGNDPSHFKGDDKPVEYVSWNEITEPGGFLDKINSGKILIEIKKQFPPDAKLRFRLPSETEWEYAARGGKYWKDNFAHSGSNDVDEVAWYKDNSGIETHAVGQKSANQLDIYDMNGNVWEWCMDYKINDTNQIPKDGSPFLGGGEDRVLRGGCHHNWAMHCRVDNRYSIIPDAADECIGFRLVLEVFSE